MFNYYKEIAEERTYSNKNAASIGAAALGTAGAVVGGVLYQKYLSKKYKAQAEFNESNFIKSLNPQQKAYYDNMMKSHNAIDGAKSPYERELHFNATEKAMKDLIESLSVQQRVLWANMVERSTDGLAMAMTLVLLGGGAGMLVGFYGGKQIDSLVAKKKEAKALVKSPEFIKDGKVSKNKNFSYLGESSFKDNLFSDDKKPKSKSQETLEKAGIGAAVGLATGAAGSLLNPVLQSRKKALKEKLKATGHLSEKERDELKSLERDVYKRAALGGSLGAAHGAIFKDQYKKKSFQKTLGGMAIGSVAGMAASNAFKKELLELSRKEANEGLNGRERERMENLKKKVSLTGVSGLALGGGTGLALSLKDLKNE